MAAWVHLPNLSQAIKIYKYTYGIVTLKLNSFHCNSAYSLISTNLHPIGFHLKESQSQVAPLFVLNRFDVKKENIQAAKVNPKVIKMATSSRFLQSGHGSLVEHAFIPPIG